MSKYVAAFKIIGILHARAVTQKEVRNSLDKRLPEAFWDNDDIMTVLVKSLQKKANIVVSRSIDRENERIK